MSRSALVIVLVIVAMIGRLSAQIINPPAGGGLPSGAIILITSGTCPAGTTEAVELAGYTLVGTLATHSDINTTGGNDNITPAGTFAGDALAAHAHTTLASGSVDAHSHTTLANGTVGSHSHTTLAAGSNAWPAGVPTFSGTSLAGHSHTILAADAGGHTHLTLARDAGGHAHTTWAKDLGGHAHELPFTNPSAGAFGHIATATFGTGTSRANTASITMTNNTASFGVLLSQSVAPTYTASASSSNAPVYQASASASNGPVYLASASSSNSGGTPAGTIAWPVNAPAFTASASASSSNIPTWTGLASASSSNTAGFTATASASSSNTGGTPSGTFSGTQFDNRQAFNRVIFCKAT